MNKYQSYINLNNMCFDRLPNTYLKPPKTNRHVTGGEKNKLMLSQSGSMRKREINLKQVSKITYQPPQKMYNRGKRRETVVQASNKNKEEDIDALKERLVTLGDRLDEIKKNYEEKKQKITNKERNILTINENKENICQIQKAASVNPQKVDEDKQREIQNYKNLSLSSIQNSLQLRDPLNAQQKDATIDDYITQEKQINCDLKHTSSEGYLLKPVLSKTSFMIEQNKKVRNGNLYYISSIIKARGEKNPNSFDQVCLAHLQNSLEFFKIRKEKNLNETCPNPKVQKINPMPPGKKHTIIFDLDETLIHCHDPKKGPGDLMMPISFPSGKKIQVAINLRPYARECLRQLSKSFQIMVFTASHASYAKAIIDYLDPDRKYISEWFSREDCCKKEGFYLKDLRVIDRKLSNMLLIDNAAYSYSLQLENGVPIVPFYRNKADFQLKNLIPYLKGFEKEDDVRVKNSATMQLDKYYRYNNIDALIEVLYR